MDKSILDPVFKVLKEDEKEKWKKRRKGEGRKLGTGEE